MQNAEIARALHEVADLLDIQGDNPFRVRAYRNAVRTISNLTRPLTAMLAAGESLEELPGIGHDIASHIRELVETGHLRRLEQLEQRVPPTLAELMRIEGMGPKRVRRLHDELNIRSLDDLEDALRAGRVQALKGCGEKTVARMLAGLAAVRARPSRILLSEADQFVGSLLEWLRELPEVEHVEAAGSYRRRGRLHLFRGLEVDILPDGALDLPEEHLRGLDIVVAAVHSHLNLSRTAMTDRVLKAIAHPCVDILAHPTGRLINRRDPFDIDMESVLQAAADHGVAVELNAQPNRLDLDDVLVRRARDLGAVVVINTDAHTAASLEFMRYGVDQARRGWLTAADVLNTRSLAHLTPWLQRRRRGARAAVS